MDKIEGQYSMLVWGSIDREKVGIIDILRIDKNTVGRLDIICMAYYSDIDFMPIFLQWNNITDVSKISIGDVIEVPDIQNILSQIKDINENKLMLNCFDNNSEEIPGIIEPNISVDKNTTSSKRGNKTIANPLLSIEQKSASYNKETGQIIYY